jgi:hypothetical protein
MGEHMERVLKAISQNSILRWEGVPDTEEELMEAFEVKVTSDESTLFVDLAPRSGEGHDYMFRIDLKTGRVIVNSITIGEIISDPEENL